MNTPLADRIRSLGPCSEAVEWLGPRTLVQAWGECERADWLLWLAARAGVDHKLVVLAACACARTALKHVPDGESRPLKAIETAEAWCRGEATLEEVRRARYTTTYATYATYTTTYATYATYTTTYATYATGSGAYSSVRAQALKDLCPLVRQHISGEVVEAALSKPGVTDQP